jgi:hypothetical protein
MKKFRVGIVLMLCRCVCKHDASESDFVFLMLFIGGAPDNACGLTPDGHLRIKIIVHLRAHLTNPWNFLDYLQLVNYSSN